MIDFELWVAAVRLMKQTILVDEVRIQETHWSSLAANTKRNQGCSSQNEDRLLVLNPG